MLVSTIVRVIVYDSVITITILAWTLILGHALFTFVVGKQLHITFILSTNSAIIGVIVAV
jgi:hypothetical protein